MKLVSFRRVGKVRIGAITEDSSEIVDFSIAAPRLPADMPPFIEDGDKALAAAAKALTTNEEKARIPSPRRNIICVDKSYYEHAKEFDAGGFNTMADAESFRRTRLSFLKPIPPCAGWAMKSRVQSYVNGNCARTRSLETWFLIFRPLFQPYLKEWRSFRAISSPQGRRQAWVSASNRRNS